jgi:RNA polymerase sigma-70 factor (ECF subfamily)
MITALPQTGSRQAIEPDALGDLFREHGTAIYNYCFRRTADWAVAEDLTSTVFLEAWRSSDRYEQRRDTALPWLYGIATNVLRNKRRAMRSYQSLMNSLPLPDSPADTADVIAARLDDEQRMRKLLETVSKLPRREQEVLALVSWAELSYEDAAEALDVPIGTVRSRLARARARLSDLLDSDQAEGMTE